MRVRVAAVQMEICILEPETNRASVLRTLETLVHDGVQLAVFPECTITGYLLENRDEIDSVAEDVPGPTSRLLAEACADLGIHAVVGLLERDGDDRYNTALLIGPNGLLERYRKAHLPPVGVDRLLTPGNIPFTVHHTPVGNIGMLICYDHRFPEAIRSLALDGMEILAHPTNSPTGISGPAGSRPAPDPFDWRAKAEKIHIVSADKCGVERGVEFAGGSFISAPTGAYLARPDNVGSAVIQAGIDTEDCWPKGLTSETLGFTNNYHAARRPDLYGRLTAPNG